MAKQQLTDAAISECVEQARDAARGGQAITEAINKLNVSDMPKALNHARAILGASRDLAECALALLHQNELQEQRRVMEKQRAELAELRKK